MLTSNPQIEKILFNKDLRSNGITMDMADGSIVILNTALFSKSLAEIDNAKISTMFGNRLVAEYLIPDDEVHSALQYVVTHELAHVLDNTFRFTSAGSYGAAHFDRISWLWNAGAKSDATTFPDRSRLMFRQQNQSLESEASAIVSQWDASDFPTLYAALSSQEDFAETVTQVLMQRSGWSFRYIADGAAIDLNERLAQTRFAGKRCFVEGLLGEDQNCEAADQLMTTGSTSRVVAARYQEQASSVVPFLGGTGYFVSPRHLITNFHVVRDECPFKGDVCPASAVAPKTRTILSRADMDFAVVELTDAENVSPARLNLDWSCDSHGGAKILSLGFPGLGGSERALFATLGRYIGHCNEDARIAEKALYSIASGPGASGSPIFNEAGEIVGMLQGTYGREKLITGSTLHGIEERTGIFGQIRGQSSQDLKARRDREAEALWNTAEAALKKTLAAAKALMPLMTSGAGDAEFDPNALPTFAARKEANVALTDVQSGPDLLGQIAVSLVQNSLDGETANNLPAVCERLKGSVNRFLDEAAQVSGLSRELATELLSGGLETGKPLLARYDCNLLSED
jgi:hypothetical protein